MHDSKCESNVAGLRRLPCHCEHRRLAGEPHQHLWDGTRVSAEPFYVRGTPIPWHLKPCTCGDR